MASSWRYLGSDPIPEEIFILTPQRRRPHPLWWGGGACLLTDNYMSCNHLLYEHA